MDIADHQLRDNLSMGGKGISEDSSSKYLLLQREVFNLCTVLSKAFPDTRVELESLTTTHLIQKLKDLDQNDTFKGQVERLISILQELNHEHLGLKRSEIKLNVTLNEEQIKNMSSHLLTARLHPFDGRIEDIGLYTTSFEVPTIKSLIANGARFICLLKDEVNLSGVAIYFRPEDVNENNPFTRSACQFISESASNTGMLFLLYADQFDKSSATYQRLVFATRLMAQNYNIDQFAAFVHENNEICANLHVRNGGFELYVDQTIPTTAPPPPLPYGKEQVTPASEFVFMTLNTDPHNNEPAKLAPTEAMRQFRTRRLAKLPNYVLKESQRIELLKEKLELLNRLEKLTPNATGEELSAIRELTERVLPERSIARFIIINHLDNYLPEFNKAVSQHAPGLIGTRTKIEREIEKRAANLRKLSV